MQPGRSGEMQPPGGGVEMRTRTASVACVLGRIDMIWCAMTMTKAATKLKQMIEICAVVGASKRKE